MTNDSQSPFPDELITRWQSHEPSVWRATFKRLWPVAFQSARRVAATTGDAEDAAASALAEFSRRPRPPGTWRECDALIAVMARRSAVARLRQHLTLKRRSADNVPLHLLEPSRELASPIPTNDCGLDLSTLLAPLDALRRRILEEHFLEGRTSLEIGERLNLNPATVRSHLFRALQDLRKAASDHEH